MQYQSIRTVVAILAAVILFAMTAACEETQTWAENSRKLVPAKTAVGQADAVPSRESKRLERVTARIDSFGDPLPEKAIARLGTERYHHGGWRKRLYFLDNERLVSFSPTPDSRVRIWEARTGRLLQELNHGGRELQACEPSADGRFLATLAWKYDQTKREYFYTLDLWNTRDWTTGSVAAWSVPAFSRATCLAYAASGATIVVGGRQGTLRFFDVASGAEVLNYSVSKREIGSMAFSRDSSLLAIADGEGVFLWDWLSGDKPNQLKGITGQAQSVLFSRSGTLLAIGKPGSFAGWLCDVGSYRVAQLIGEAEEYHGEGLAFSHDGNLLAVPTSGPNNKVEIFNVASRKVVRKLKANVETLDVALSPDGRVLATGGAEAVIETFDLLTGQALNGQPVAHRARIDSIEFMPNGSNVVTSSMDGTIRLWEADTGRQIRMFSHEGWVVVSAPSPDLQRIASVSFDDTLRLWDIDTGKQLLRLPGHGTTGGTNEFAMGFSPDGFRLLSFGSDGLLRVWNARSGAALGKYQIGAGRARGRRPPSDRTMGARFTTDGKTLLVGRAKSLSFYDVESGREVEQLRLADRLLRFSVSPDGRLLATVEQQDASDDHHPTGQVPRRRTWLRLRDFYTKEVNQEKEVSNFTYQLEFSPNSKLLAASLNRSTANGTSRWISVWETKTGDEYARVAGFSGQPIALAFSADDKWLASADLATTSVLIWDLNRSRVGRRLP